MTLIKKYCSVVFCVLILFSSLSMATFSAGGSASFEIGCTVDGSSNNDPFSVSSVLYVIDEYNTETIISGSEKIFDITADKKTEISYSFEDIAYSGGVSTPNHCIQLKITIASSSDYACKENAYEFKMLYDSDSKSYDVSQEMPFTSGEPVFYSLSESNGFSAPVEFALTKYQTKKLALISKGKIYEKIYDGSADADLVGAINDYIGLMGVDASDDVSLIYESAEFNTSSAISANKISINGLKLIGDDAWKYSIGTANIVISGKINPKEITVTANNLTKTKGATDPELTFLADGVVPGESSEGNLQRQDGENEGEYKITIGTLDFGSNYKITKFTDGLFTITAFAETKLENANNGITVEGYFDAVTTLNVKKTEQGTSTYNSLLKLVKNPTVIGAYEISLSGGKNVGSIKMTFKIPTSFQGKQLSLAHILSDGTTEVLSATADNGLVTFTVNSLSPFMLCFESDKFIAGTTETLSGENESNQGSVGKTILKIFIIILIVVLVLVVIVILFFIYLIYFVDPKKAKKIVKKIKLFFGKRK